MKHWADFPGSQAASWVDHPPLRPHLVVDVVGAVADCVQIQSPSSPIADWVYTVPRSEVQPIGPVASALLKVRR